MKNWNEVKISINQPKGGIYKVECTTSIKRKK